MNPLRTMVLGGAAVLALSLGAGYAAAQAPTPTEHAKASADGWEHHGGMHGGPGGSGGHERGHMAEHRAEHLRTILQLTPAQEPALTAFLASMQHKPEAGEHHFEIPRGADGKVDTTKLHADMQARRAEMEKKHAEEAALTTPQKLDLMVKHMAEESAKRQAALQTHVEAIKRFYAALTPSQQKAFDALHGGGMGERGGMHGGGFRHHGEHGPGEGGPHFGMMGPMSPMHAPPSGER